MQKATTVTKAHYRSSLIIYREPGKMARYYLHRSPRRRPIDAACRARMSIRETFKLLMTENCDYPCARCDSRDILQGSVDGTRRYRYNSNDNPCALKSPSINRERELEQPAARGRAHSCSRGHLVCTLCTRSPRFFSLSRISHTLVSFGAQRVQNGAN